MLIIPNGSLASPLIIHDPHNISYNANEAYPNGEYLTIAVRLFGITHPFLTSIMYYVCMSEFDIEKSLDNLGFIVDNIVEVILTSQNSLGATNAAPMGVKRTGPLTLELKPFNSSTSYRNLLEHSRTCLNVTSDPMLFLHTAFKTFPFPATRIWHIDDELRLVPSDARVFVKVDKHWAISPIRTGFIGTIYNIEVSYSHPHVFNRGRAEAIEAIIHATRIQTYMEKGDKQHVKHFVQLYEEAKSVINRVSSLHSSETAVIQTLDALINSWRKKTSPS